MPDEKDVAQDKRALEQNEREGTPRSKGNILNTHRSRERKHRRNTSTKTRSMKAAICYIQKITASRTKVSHTPERRAVGI